MVGPWVDSGALLLGGVVGALLGRYLPERVTKSLPMVFGVITISLGSTFVLRAVHLPVVVVAMILGTLIGELMYAEEGLSRALRFCLQWASRHVTKDARYVTTYVTLIAAMCCGSMGLMGAVNEGVSGNPEILLIKAVLDFFTAWIYAATMGFPIALIAIPQFVIQAGLFMAGGLIHQYTNEAMIANFVATGGVIFLATGLRLCEIKVMAVVNMMPALVLAFPLTALWTRIIQ